MNASPELAALAGGFEAGLSNLLCAVPIQEAEQFLKDALAIPYDGQFDAWMELLIKRINGLEVPSSKEVFKGLIGRIHRGFLKELPKASKIAQKDLLRCALQRLQQKLDDRRSLAKNQLELVEFMRELHPMLPQQSPPGNLPDRFSYHFYRVGQGLFASGSIRKVDEGVPRFLWVYDCGTSSSPNLIDDGIRELKRWSGARSRIDLLTLSHFDHDHISGVARLLKVFAIGTLMLPYMPLAQRLVVAFEEQSGAPNDPLSAFYVNPVEYLLGLGGPGIERILFVLPSGGDGPPFPVEGPNQTVLGPDVPPILDFNRGRPESSDEFEFLDQAAQSAGANTVVEFLRPGSTISVQTCLWEFVPYNDDPKVLITEEFIQKAETERSNLLAAATHETRSGALRRLKQAYDFHIGSGSEARNIISLFLYSGPVYPSWSGYALIEPVSMPSGQATFFPSQIPLPWDRTSEGDLGMRCSILYTGDGYLNSAERLQRLTRYLHPKRIEWTAVFQVMHHGARANWHRGVAAAIAPRFSVFSSDPRRKLWRHPHASVLRDFWPFGAVQVDKEFGFEISGQLSGKALASVSAGDPGSPAK